MAEKKYYNLKEAQDKLAFNYACVLFHSRFSFVFAVSNFVAGTAVVVIKQLEKPFSVSLAVYLSLLVISALYSALFVFARRMPKEKWLAVIDDCNESGGLVVSARETGDVQWLKEKEMYRIPKLVARKKTNNFFIAASVVFLIACFLVPAHKTYNAPGKIKFDEITVKDAEKINMLKEQGLISEQEAIEYSQMLENISNSAKKNNIGKSLEALDKFRNKMSFIDRENITKAELSQNEHIDLHKAEQKHDSNRNGKAVRAYNGLNGYDSSSWQKKESSESKTSERQSSKFGIDNELRMKLESFEKKDFGSSESDKRASPGNIAENKSEKNGENESKKKSGNGGTTKGGESEKLSFDRKTSSHDVGYKDNSIKTTNLIDISDYSHSIEGYSSPSETSEKKEIKSYDNAAQFKHKLKSTHYEREIILPRHKKSVIKYFGENGAKQHAN